MTEIDFYQFKSILNTDFLFNFGHIHVELGTLLISMKCTYIVCVSNQPFLFHWFPKEPEFTTSSYRNNSLATVRLECDVQSFMNSVEKTTKLTMQRSLKVQITAN